MCAYPAPADDALLVKFWGVRGSIPVCGTDHVIFGGHTPCVEIRCGGQLFIIDAGTGITNLGLAIKETAPAQIEILLSHLHLDHVMGLPFFKPALYPDKTIRLSCGNLDGQTAEKPLERLFAPPIFPVTLAQLPAKFVYNGFRAGETLSFGPHSVRTCPLDHPSGATAYRFDYGGRSVCYVSDVEHGENWPPENLIEFVLDADLVIYDAMFCENEYSHCRGWGHSTISAGVELCRRGHVKQLAAFHMHPMHNDAFLLDMEADLAKAMPGSFVARQGQSLVFAPVAMEVPA
ncbi:MULTISPECIES: MBL fold metallo-hydrolase [unclassified Chelatococcus]|uniref:MBL fold metallo-hydrolase n=1 Tax=unclassified Chelatococcus TaxID=2638111 RepID=UPI001BCBE788|nr:MULTISPECIES: MBL fold metallo-hydrolase [unclassified Chelatococcus]CAH1659054.1 Phosphoribosyl 1,2-cyclic phosphodiesterase [Hyphomicrobiales bacterium]MBS7740886.1 MBL fold metallo-hydrolase [Chelatococcus sp. HY11]MBX3546823.1 MBL fold metallo-hydrolase [Chelatococcus sp.]MCO5077704.1 MBL fold metallo-hydrolase [Chelatococcus sp.]CAH1683942.1 Phosphoribosyl 1,2-cyclic phosphodiesterase [Hyphomicrobiales bacterium]